MKLLVLHSHSHTHTHTHTHTRNSLLFDLSSGDLSVLSSKQSWREEEDGWEREKNRETWGPSFSFYLTNQEINKSLWAFDRSWWDGAVRCSWTIYEAVAASLSQCAFVCVCVCVSAGRWLAGESEYCLKYLNVCVHFTPDLWAHRRDGDCRRKKRRRRRGESHIQWVCCSETEMCHHGH